MMDPYKVLGVSSNASNDEIKKAYRDLSRKYHPDSYANNPLANLAEEKFKEVQEAYNQIMKEREGGYTSTGSAYQSTSSYGSGNDSMELEAAFNYVNARRYREAINVLNGIGNRQASWYYCSAVANAGIGNNFVALNHARQAVNMEPNNPEYQRVLNQLQMSGQRYGTTSQGYGYGSRNDDMMNMCCNLWCADTLCECMGGDLCACM